MRIYWTFLFLIVLKCIIAQGQDYSVQYNEVPLQECLNDLEDRYELLFSFKPSALDEKYVTFSTDAVNLKELCDILFRTNDLEWKLVDQKYILLTAVKREQLNLSGVITDAKTNQPLPYATISIEGTNVGVESDSIGRWSLSYNFSKDDRLEFSYLGFKSKIEEPDFFTRDKNKSIGLEIMNVDLPFLVISDYIIEGINLENNGSSTVINPSSLGQLPGQVDPDLFKSLQSLPGLSAPTSKVSDISIRGGTPDQNLIIWEDIPIYHSAHYFGMISSLDAFTVKDMKVYRGGFGVEYGGRVAGVIDVSANDETAVEPTLGVGANMCHAYLYGLKKFGKAKKTALSFSLRRSYSELFETPTLKNITRTNQQGFIIGNRELVTIQDDIKVDNSFSYLDSNFKLSSKLGDKDRIEFAGLIAQNDFSDEIIDSDRMETQRDSMVLENIGFSVNWQHSWSPKLSSSLKVIGTQYNYDYEYLLKSIDTNVARVSGTKENMISDRQLSLTTNYLGQSDQNISLGYHLINYDINFNVSELTTNRRDKVNDSGDSKSSLHSLFLSYNNPISNIIGVNLGLRTSYFGFSKSFYTEPRIRISYQLNDNFTLSTTYGRHHQFVGQVTAFRGNESGINFQLWALSENKSIPVQQADIFQAGLIYKKNKWLIDLQLYSKEVKGLSSRAYNLEYFPLDNPQTGKSNTSGIDLLVKRKFKNFSSWVSYSYSNSTLTFREIFDGPVTSDIDQGHQFHWTGQARLRNWDFAIGYKISSGLPYSTIENFRIISPPNAPTEFDAKYEEINNFRLPANQEVNLSAQYQFKSSLDAWNGFINFSAINIFNTKNLYNRTFYIESQNMSPPEIYSIDKSKLGFTPNISLRFEF